MVCDMFKLSVDREDYYLRKIAESRERYLSGDGEAPGRWLGQAAERLGLAGEASAEGFKRMFRACHPATGELLGSAHGKRGMPAWDVVFRPVKDLSVLYALGSEQDQRAAAAAHAAGVRAAVAYLERHVGTRRGHAGIQKVAGNG